MSLDLCVYSGSCDSTLIKYINRVSGSFVSKLSIPCKPVLWCSVLTKLRTAPCQCPTKKLFPFALSFLYFPPTFPHFQDGMEDPGCELNEGSSLFLHIPATHPSHRACVTVTLASSPSLIHGCNFCQDSSFLLSLVTHVHTKHQEFFSSQNRKTQNRLLCVPLCHLSQGTLDTCLKCSSSG